MKHTEKEKAGMLIACASMIGIGTKGEFFDLLKYIIANEKDYFAPKPTKKEE